MAQNNTMISDIYSSRILSAAASAPPSRCLESPDASAHKLSRICGSEVRVDLNVSDGVVVDFAMDAKACALGQASASIVARNIVGASAPELYRLRDEMAAMLKENGAPPTGERWVDLAALEVVRDFPQRHASVMLVFEAVCACLDSMSEAGAGSDTGVGAGSGEG